MSSQIKQSGKIKRLPKIELDRIPKELRCDCGGLLTLAGFHPAGIDIGTCQKCGSHYPVEIEITDVSLGGLNMSDIQGMLGGLVGTLQPKERSQDDGSD